MAARGRRSAASRIDYSFRLFGNSRDADPGVLIHVVIPEFVVPGFWSQILHNQTAFAIKATLIFEPGVAVTSIPWHLASAEPRPLNGQLRARTTPDLGHAKTDTGGSPPV